MALSAGTRLGPYEILAPLGAGGMGEVYRARDTRLDRTVAIKVLPSHLSASPELQRRLEREAKAISQLSHPHICTLHDVGREGETDFLVMEYLAGETLARRLEKGPLPLEQALRTASEIADALDNAHRQSVVHRDLKPGNIMLTKSGAKLLDFGLAKLRGAGSVEEVAAVSALPTQAQPLTEEGKIVGTYAYMAPEQLEGGKADARTDIFALGAVLYEMVTGKRAFEGKSRASLIAAILSSDPRPIRERQPMTPPLLDRVVKRCLAKDPDDRWQSAGDLTAELQWIAEGVAGLDESTLAANGRRRLGLLPWAISAALLAGLVWSLVRTPAPRALTGPVVRAALPLAADEDIAYARHLPLGVGRPSLALSPDGSKVAFVVEDGESTRIHLRGLAEADATPLGGTEGGFDPFFSPDGHWLAFFTADRLKKVSLRGGEPVTLCEATNPYGATWGEDDTILFSGRLGVELTRVTAAGDKAEVIATADLFPRLWPQFLPGDEAVLLSEARSQNSDFWSLIAFFPESGETKLVLEGGSFARYVPTGHLIYTRGGAVHAVPFDPERVEVTGASTLVLDGVRVEREGTAHLSYSLDGTLVYVPGEATNTSELVWVDRKGRVDPLGLPPFAFGTFQLAPDNRRLAVEVYERQTEVWIYDLERHTRHKLAPESDSRLPLWSPDGQRLAFVSDRDGRSRIYWKSADGSGVAERVVPNDERNMICWSWSPDGGTLAISAGSPRAREGLSLVSLDGEREVRPFLDETPAEEWGADISPDGRWLAYVSDISGRYEVHVQAFPAGGRTWTVSTDGGEEPIWSPRGDELFYRSGDRWMVVEVGPGSTFSASAPHEVFRGPFPNVTGRSYDVGPDARRFLVLRDVARGDHSQQPQLILNWFEELKAKMGEGSE